MSFENLGQWFQNESTFDIFLLIDNHSREINDQSKNGDIKAAIFVI